ncbi:hypothetical protein Celal_2085 [Cellulophaga algicola DSM 14237]|uniref:Membrane or secreted protein n=1 Tax=Cellulophaga algicola (strain DSM 14237 / IC166 / ACAM 630) TaxID=688270 RepID=E6X4Q5_CELAD|nr:hypothetical protein [Cellulophaga algicola]ADV49380.1 hypothetical protein Celal_2085 [Cellulophaga algicola DSM 14237]
MKKAFVLIVLFVLPIVAYLFFASGVHNFGKLPVLTETVFDVSTVDSTTTFKNKITILGFLGNDVDFKKGNALNLNQKIYKDFHKFSDFQFVMIMPEGTEESVKILQKELSGLAEIDKWKFVFASPEQIQLIFNSLDTDLSLDESYSTPYVFIVDKDAALRGRNQDEEHKTIYGFDATSVAELTNKMIDDVRIILAEYRMALKKNNANREI